MRAVPTSRFLTFSTLITRLRGLALAAIIAIAALAAAPLVGSGLDLSDKAEAAVAMPALGTAPTLAAEAETVRWVCGPWRCSWRPNWNNWYVPPYARAWGPPVAPNCYWRRNWGGAWVHICP